MASNHTMNGDGGRGRQHGAGRAGDAVAGPVPAADLEDALFDEVRQHLESMIGWAKSEEALALEHDQFEARR